MYIYIYIYIITSGRASSLLRGLAGGGRGGRTLGLPGLVLLVREQPAGADVEQQRREQGRGAVVLLLALASASLRELPRAML